MRADEVKSGLKPGEAPAAFLVQDATGPAAGTKLCYRCRYGGNPVVAVFTHKLDANLTYLVKKVDAEVEKNKDKKLKAFVVLLTDDPDKAEPQLKKLAETNNIKNVPLTIFDGPLGTARLQAFTQGRDDRAHVGEERREGQPRLLLRRQARRAVDRIDPPRHEQESWTDPGRFEPRFLRNP